MVLVQLLLLPPSCAGGGGGGAEGVDGPEVTPEVSPEVCPGGMLMLDGSCLADPVPLCEPWQLPRVDGTCEDIGPRRCPLAWNAGLEGFSCAPEDFLECPDGTVPSGDGSYCIPHLISCDGDSVPLPDGTCKEIGPWGADPAFAPPVFDDCPEGLLARPGGGCVPVGPRACSKLWDPESIEDCEVEIPRPCPDGWAESEDGVYCIPGYAACDPGDRPLVDGTCVDVGPPPGGCGTDPFPTAPEGVASVQYVLASSACQAGCGAEDQPWPTIQVAVDAAPVGGAVLVGAGIYPDGLRLKNSVQVIGRCPKQTIVQGALPPSDPAETEAAAATVWVEGAEDVVLSGLGIQGGCPPGGCVEGTVVPGIALEGAQGVLLENIEVALGRGVGVSLRSSSGVTFSNVFVHDTVVGSSPLAGSGIVVDGGANLTIEGSLVEAITFQGIAVSGTAGAVLIRDTTVRGTGPNVGHNARAIRLNDVAAATVERVVLENNICIGLDASDGTKVDAIGTLIRNTAPDPAFAAQEPDDYKIGFGVQVSGAATANLADVLIEDSYLAGITAAGPDVTLNLDSVTVRGTQPDQDGTGIGIALNFGAKVDLRRTLLEENTLNALWIYDNKKEDVEIRGSLLRSTLPFEGAGVYDAAVLVTGRSKLWMTHSLIEGNSGGGILLLDYFAPVNPDPHETNNRLDLFESVIRDSVYFSYVDGYGLTSGHQSRAYVHDTLLSRNESANAAVFDQGSIIEMHRCLLRDATIDSSGNGFGVRVTSGGKVDLQDSAVSGSTSAAVLVDGITSGDPVAKPTFATITRSILLGTGCTDSVNAGSYNGTNGYGVMAQNAAEVTILDSLFEMNREAGVRIEATDQPVRIERTILRNTTSNEHGEFGYGVTMVNAGDVVVDECLVEDNMSTGIRLAGLCIPPECTEHDPQEGAPLTSATVKGTYILGTIAEFASGEFGHGLQVDGDAEVVLRRSLIEDNDNGGIRVIGPPTPLLTMEDSIIRSCHATEKHNACPGLQVSHGARCMATRCLLEGNEGAGLHVGAGGAAATLVQSVMRNQESGLSVPEWEYGYGVQVSAQGEVDLLGCVVEGNRGVGVVVGGAEFSEVRLTGSIVRGTQVFEDGSSGEGVTTLQSGHATLSRSLVQGNASAGLAAFGAVGATLDHCAILDTRLGSISIGRNAVEEIEEAGDGVFVGGAAVDMTATLVAGNARHGTYFYEGSGELKDSVISKNERVGLATRPGVAPEVVFKDQGNQIFGNQDDINENETSLPVSDPPGVTEPSSKI